MLAHFEVETTNSQDSATSDRQTLFLCLIVHFSIYGLQKRRRMREVFGPFFLILQFLLDWVQKLFSFDVVAAFSLHHIFAERLLLFRRVCWCQGPEIYKYSSVWTKKVSPSFLSGIFTRWAGPLHSAVNCKHIYVGDKLNPYNGIN